MCSPYISHILLIFVLIVSGFSDNGGDNQKVCFFCFFVPDVGLQYLTQWQLEQGPGGHWTFRSAASGQYLGVGGPFEDGTPLVSVDEPVRWDIYPDDQDSSVFRSAFFLFPSLHVMSVLDSNPSLFLFCRIYVPGAPTALNIDLSDHGNPTPGTIVTLWGKWEGKNQTWRFEQVY